MLLEFKIKNYKSFAEETSFSMMAAPKQKGLDYSLIKKKIKNETFNILSSSVVYGPNASGKTNIIGAMDSFRTIVLRGNILNQDNSNHPNSASIFLELIPNNKLKEKQPVEFFIDFISDNNRFQYSLLLDLGTFLDSEYDRKVLEEELSINGSFIFKRNDTLKFGDFAKINQFINIDDEDSFNTYLSIGVNSLNKKELFLTNGFKSIFSPKIANFIIEWFVNKFMVIYRADSLQLARRFVDPKQNIEYVEKTTNEAVKLFGADSNKIGYVKSDDNNNARLCSIFKDEKNNKAIALSAEMIESYGTVRFITMFPLIMIAIKTGGTLVVDEFDASIHPMALMSILNVFHNDEINIKGAQLIFNTHNPIFLNSNLLRRDEIKFVEKNYSTNYSDLYSLSDFGTDGKNGVRKGEDYMKQYFVNKYGAIRDIDFSSVFEHLFDDEVKDGQ